MGNLLDFARAVLFAGWGNPDQSPDERDRLRELAQCSQVYLVNSVRGM